MSPTWTILICRQVHVLAAESNFKVIVYFIRVNNLKIGVHDRSRTSREYDRWHFIGDIF